MTTDTDKLVEMARAAGFAIYKGTIYCQGLRITEELAAFAAAHVASLCADVEPVAFGIFASNGNIRFWACDKASADSQAAKTGGDVVGIYPASTVAAITAQRDAALARVAELEKDAARYRWLRSVPNAFKAQRIVNDTPHGMDATIDAAMNGGNQ